jgi:ribosomal-protein-alanine N-acetyltransferase
MSVTKSAACADLLPRRGDGFLLRRLSVGDLAEFQAYRRDPELGRYQGWSVLSEVDARTFLGEMNCAPLLTENNWTQIGIADHDTQRLIGDIGLFLDPDGRRAEIGFTLARPAHGRGIATAAVREAIKLIFAATNAERVVGITDARNFASVRLLERVGMRRTETKETDFRGEPCIEYVYEILRGDA